jgi:hypothetical protein
LLTERINSVEDFAQKNLLGMLNFVCQTDRENERKKKERKKKERKKKERKQKKERKKN